MTEAYSLDDLERLSGVERRTIRLFIEKGLIDRPSGRGRGAHYGELHLQQLRYVRLLQNAGLDHAAILAHRAELESSLSARGLNLQALEKSWTNFASQALSAHGLERRAKEPKVEKLIRVKIIDGVDLIIANGLKLPPAGALADLLAALAESFTRANPRKTKP